MDLRTLLGEVWESLEKGDSEQAFSLMSENLEEGETKEYNKDLKRRAKQDKILSPHYKGVDSTLAKWGKEAHSYGMHAHGMEQGGKASKEKIVDAHSEAEKAHHFAYVKLDRAGHPEVAGLHKTAFKYHQGKVKQLIGKAPVEEGAMDDLRAANSHAHMAQWRATQLKKKIANKSSGSKPDLKYSAVVKKPVKLGESVYPFFFLEGYEDAVKQASINAGKASKMAQTSGGDHHKTASTLHGIAAGIAGTHGHTDLRDKHLDFQKKHSDEYKAAKPVKTA